MISIEEMEAQRNVRQRIIEYLELASSIEEQIEYQKAVPYVNVPREIINQWEDYVPNIELSRPNSEIYSFEEQEAIRTFGIVWDEVANDMPEVPPSIERIGRTSYWQALMSGADRALEVMRRRGHTTEA